LAIGPLTTGRGAVGLLRFSDVAAEAEGRQIDSLPTFPEWLPVGPVRPDQFVGVSELSGASGLPVLATDLLNNLRPLRLRLAGSPTLNAPGR
jgi:hypothetical protein